MKKTVAILLIVLFAAVPALAGEKKKCSYEAQECLDAMVSKFESRGWVGVELDMDEESGTLTITKTEHQSPAEAAGLKKGDVLVALNGIRFSEENKEAMKGAQAKMTIGATVTYTVERGGRNMDVDITLAAIPDAVMAKWVGRHMLEHSSITVAQNN